jgi:ABC-type transport system involved in multi-copper enzyme maturation permease subunit
MTTNKTDSQPRLEELNLLLNEYGEKLIKLCEKIEDYRIKYYLTSFLFLVFGGCIVLITWATSFFKENIYFAILGVLFFTLFIIYTAIFVQNIKRRLKSLEKTAKQISFRLEKIIRVASQIHNQTDQLSILALESDLRLADAESALEYYQEIIGK